MADLAITMTTVKNVIRACLHLGLDSFVTEVFYHKIAFQCKPQAVDVARKYSELPTIRK